MKRLSFLGVFLAFLSLEEGVPELLGQEKHFLQEKEKKKNSRHAFSKLVRHNSEVIPYMRWLFTEQAVSPLSQVYPISFEEIRYIMKEYLDRNKLSPQGRSLYDQIWFRTQKTVTWGIEDWLVFDPEIDVHLRFYGVPNREDRFWYFDYYAKRPSLLTLSMGISLFDHLYMGIAIKVRPDRLYQAKSSNTSWTNSVTHQSGLDMIYPQQAYASLSFSHFNLQGGRGVLSWGNGRSGNLMLSDSPEALNYLQVATWWKFIKFTSLWIFLDNSRPELNDPNNPHSYKFYDNTHFMVAQIPREVLPAKFFLAHRLDFRLGDRMTLSLSEAVLYQDYWQNVGFLNPFYLFHNWYLTGHADYFLSVDINLALMQGWSVYTQVLLDQVPAGLNRLSEGSQAYPSSIPLIIGTEITQSLAKGYINWTVEFVKIDPYSYLDRSSVGLWMDKHWLTSAFGVANHLLDRVPLGYYLGNDLLRIWSQLRWEEPFFYSVWLEGSILWKGDNSILTPWSDAPGQALKLAPSGKVMSEYVFGIGGDINISKWLSGQNLKFDTAFAWISRSYLGRWSWDIQYSIGIEWFY